MNCIVSCFILCLKVNCFSVNRQPTERSLFFTLNISSCTFYYQFWNTYKVSFEMTSILIGLLQFYIFCLRIYADSKNCFLSYWFCNLPHLFIKYVDLAITSALKEKSKSHSILLLVPPTINPNRIGSLLNCNECRT